LTSPRLSHALDLRRADVQDSGRLFHVDERLARHASSVALATTSQLRDLFLPLAAIVGKPRY